MGDPRRTRSKYQGPRHPWNKQRIEEEKVLVREYGLVNKKELWKVDSKLKSFKDNTKTLLAKSNEQSKRELDQIFRRIHSLGLIQGEVTADEVLGLTTQSLLNRRLQTVVFKKGLARSIKQARQFITHQHIMVGDKKVTVPAYIVPIELENSISFVGTSNLASDDHPERVILQKTKGVKSEEAQLQEEMPVTKTKEESSENKPIEAQIEAETTDAKEVKEAVEAAHADEIAKDHEKEVEKEAKK